MFADRYTALVGGVATAAVLVVSPLVLAAAVPAPGAPGEKATWTEADKNGFGTSRTSESEVWFTLRPGSLSEVYYPDLGTPALRELEFVVTDGTSAETTGAVAGRTRAPDPRVPGYEQTDTAPDGGWRMVRRVVTDPARDAVLVEVTFESLDGRPYEVFAVADPALSNSGADDRATVTGGNLLAWDDRAGLALASDGGLADGTVGYLGTSDARTDLLADGYLDDTYAEAERAGNVVVAGRLDGVTGLGDARGATLALAFADRPETASDVAEDSLAAGFATAADAYARGWRDYLDGLAGLPAAAADIADEYWASVVVNAASEDKRNPGAFIASPSMPWVWGQEVPDLSSPSEGYHLVWSRDLYQHATALLAAGDRAAADRALDFILQVQQRPDGSVPQNSTVSGDQAWDELQLDEVALPLVLAWQLGRTDPATLDGVRRGAEFLLGYAGDHPAPWSPQERWENQSGYSPSTIAAQIAGLVCAADLARRTGDAASADRWLGVARDWAARVDAWTVTSTGPLSPQPYYLRLSKDGDPNAPTTYNVGDGGGTLDQRAVVDPSFLELVRLGIKPASDPVVLNTLDVVDRSLRVDTPAGQFWHRFTDDGYGEDADGGPWRITDPDTQATVGRVWPIFAGERGEYELLAGTGDPAARLAAMAATANDGLMIAEQVWDGPPGDPGTGTRSATPLTWSHAQLIRLAWSIDAGTPVERPAVVACEFLRQSCPG